MFKIIICYFNFALDVEDEKEEPSQQKKLPGTPPLQSPTSDRKPSPELAPPPENKTSPPPPSPPHTSEPSQDFSNSSPTVPTPVPDVVKMSHIPESRSTEIPTSSEVQQCIKPKQGITQPLDDEPNMEHLTMAAENLVASLDEVCTLPIRSTQNLY